MVSKRSSIVATKAKKSINQLKSKVTKKVIKQWLTSIVTAIAVTIVLMFLLGLFLFFVNSVVKYFPPYMKVQTISSILTSLVELVGILLGFSGIIFVQVLGSLMDQQNIAYERLLDKPKTISEKPELRDRYLDVFESKRRNLVAAVFVTFFLFIASIFDSLKRIADVSGVLGDNPEVLSWQYLQYPLLLVLGGLVTLLFSISAFSLKPPPPFRELKKQPDESTKE